MFPSSRQRYQEIFQPSTSPVASWKDRSAVQGDECYGYFKDNSIPTTFCSSSTTSTRMEGFTMSCHLSPSSWSLIRHEHLQDPLPYSFQPHHHPYTVVVGRGRAARSNLGNKRLRVLASNYLSLYATTPMRKVKTQIVNEIFNTIQHANGIFVIHREDKRWYQTSDTVAREKIGYTLRDMLSDEYKSSSKSKMLAARRKREQDKSHHRFFFSSDEEQDPTNGYCHQPQHHHTGTRMRFTMSCPPDYSRSIFSLDTEKTDEPYSCDEYDSFSQAPIAPPPPFLPTSGNVNISHCSCSPDKNQSSSNGVHIKQKEEVTRLDASSTVPPITSSIAWDIDDEESVYFPFN